MPDVVLDANTLGDFLSQYFSPASSDRGRRDFAEEGRLSRNMVVHINRILDSFRRYESGAYMESAYLRGLVVASAFAFIELCRNWDRMVDGRFSPEQLKLFIVQTPEWFNIAPVDESLLPFYCAFPTHVYLRDEFVAIEWCDAIHAATADSRGDDTLLATSDQRLQAVPHLRNRILA